MTRVWLVAYTALVVGCGGATAPLVTGDDGGQDATADSPVGPDAVVVDVVTLDVRVIDVSVCKLGGSPCATPGECCSQQCIGGICSSLPPPPPGCRPDGAQCGSPADCCSQICAGGVCNPTPPPPPPPPCRPQGAQCNSWMDCCSETCSAGSCTGGPVACVIQGTTCQQCLEQNCCAQLSNCQMDPQCNNLYFCFVKCQQAGGGAQACAQQCFQMFPSQLAIPLQMCAAQGCGMSCQ